MKILSKIKKGFTGPTACPFGSLGNHALRSHESRQTQPARIEQMFGNLCRDVMREAPPYPIIESSSAAV